MEIAIRRIQAATTELDLSNLGLTELPEIPESIKVLYLDDNKLIKLPPLHEGLTDLSISNNQLISLPVLPNSLQYLWCQNNNLLLLSFPLPEHLKFVDCRNNFIRTPPKFQDQILYEPQNELPVRELESDENAVTRNKIIEGQAMVNFQGEADLNSPRYYKLSTIQKLRPLKNPFTRKTITDISVYRAKTRRNRRRR